MKRAMVISILCAVFLSACGNAAETSERAVSIETPVVSQTTTTITASAVTSAKEEKDTSETTTTTRKSSQTVSETSASMETIKAKTTTKSTQPPQEQTEPQSYPQTEQPQENTQVNTTQKTAVTTTQQKQTTAKKTTTAPPKPATTTQKAQTTTQKPSTAKPQNTVQWSDTMKAWRKLCEGKSLSGKEQDLIRSEILEYAESFNGKKNIHVSFGIDEYDISYEKPLNLIIRNDMTDLSYAHMDSYVDADSKWLIDYAGSEEEIYSIVSNTREDCLHVIDYGLFNRWEIYSGNDMLKYASDIEFNVGFDGTAIWFLTED
ncbi:MAG: hypothetical protein ACI4JA_11090 [Oscillospiraceae bacterium]